jgi:hypothetical protein
MPKTLLAAIAMIGVFMFTTPNVSAAQSVGSATIHAGTRLGMVTDIFMTAVGIGVGIVIVGMIAAGIVVTDTAEPSVVGDGPVAHGSQTRCGREVVRLRNP